MSDQEREGNEFFALINGKKEDAHLHEEMAKGVDENAVTDIIRHSSLGRGYTEEFLARTLGIPSAPTQD